MDNQSILDQVRVASPCTARWEDMAGDDRARFCQHCQKHVFNLSALTRVEAEALIRAKEGNFCGRFHRRRDGRMLTADCPTGRQRRRDRVAQWWGAAVATLMVFLGGRVSLRAAESKPTAPDKPLPSAPAKMGEICISTNTPPPTNHPIMGIIAAPPAGTNRPPTAPAK